MNYHLKNAQGEVVNTIVLADPADFTVPDGFRLEAVPDAPAPAAPEPRLITPLAFLLRMTTAERIAVQTNTNPVIQDWLLLARTARYVDLDFQPTEDGLLYLTAQGVLAAGRAAEILDAPVIDLERP